ncbi:polymer-forming cytoskeletal protein [Zavarzinia compransoris]|uniref:bactofilin family protein n=1 Tax=Zavarzinia marina TaxID=2911065 RepID=UPI001F44F6E2|nr:polymer-forming cytoskeletal protein [Zavarzinia marina]MCF4166858.1 polymer-forming cytoskeletal protein [Zavarzinia marina]
MADNDSTGFRPEIARRTPDLPGMSRPLVQAPSPAAPPTSDDKKLIVGRNIVLSGQITACDKLVVEGRVDATLTDSRVIEITSTGVFKGAAEIDEALIGGTFEGDLLCRGRLLIRATGRVKGKIRYGQLEIECGGELVGDINTVEGKDAKPAAEAAPELVPAPAPEPAQAAPKPSMPSQVTFPVSPAADGSA